VLGEVYIEIASACEIEVADGFKVELNQADKVYYCLAQHQSCKPQIQIHLFALTFV
jgi:hypothetical protein